ncbi:MAG: hypothetical protein JXB05_07395 [Myxococcaceae bacterium]|nr:hypothetical protein [Myxococcaceae bacterium]
MSYFTFTPVCAPAGAAAPQATFTPVNCNITLATLCTPVCGQQAAAAPQAAANPPTRIGCGTLPTICNPTFMHCTTNVAAAPQAAAPQGLTVFTLCTPVCNTITPVQC